MTDIPGRRHLAFWTLPLLAASACQRTGFEPQLPVPGEEVLVRFDQNLSHWPDAPWGLMEASVQNDTLVVTIQHGGGCAEHRYWLLATDGFTELPTAGPVPTVSVPLRIAHDDGGDACEALLSPTLRWSLDPLREAYRSEFGPGAVVMTLPLPEGQGSTSERSLSWGPVNTEG